MTEIRIAKVGYVGLKCQKKVIPIVLKVFDIGTTVLEGQH